jgi:hypothetical protein
MKLNLRNIDLDDLGREAVRLGREVAERAHELNLGQGSSDGAFVKRCLTHLKERQTFSEADDSSLTAVDEMLKNEIDGEIIGAEVCFYETHFDEVGQHGEQREVPVYSQRGAELIELKKILRDFQSIRHAVLDHIAAHRTLMNIMSG